MIYILFDNFYINTVKIASIKLKVINFNYLNQERLTFIDNYIILLLKSKILACFLLCYDYFGTFTKLLTLMYGNMYVYLIHINKYIL